MSIVDPLALMHAVLDGEATPEEAEALERLLRQDAAARAQFDALGELFSQLDALPMEHPPEGLVAAVSAALPPKFSGAGSQLSGAGGVIGSNNPSRRGANHSRRAFMPQSRSFLGQRKHLIATGVALTAAVVVWQFGLDSWPLKQDVSGTVMPAQRYRAPQAGAAGVTLGDQTLAQLMQNDAFMRMVRDPQVQKLVNDPGFVAAAKVLRESPEAAKWLAGNKDAGEELLRAPHVAAAMDLQIQTHLAIRKIADSYRALQADPEMAAALKKLPELDRLLRESAEIEKISPDLMAPEKVNLQQYMDRVTKAQAAMERVNLAMDKLPKKAEFASLVAADRRVNSLVQANLEWTRMAQSALEATRAVSKSDEAGKIYMAHASVMQAMLKSPSMSRLMSLNADAARTVLAHPTAAQAMLANPQVSLMMLKQPESAQKAVMALAAERINR